MEFRTTKVMVMATKKGIEITVKMVGEGEGIEVSVFTGMTSIILIAMSYQ